MQVSKSTNEKGIVTHHTIIFPFPTHMEVPLMPDNRPTNKRLQFQISHVLIKHPSPRSQALQLLQPCRRPNPELRYCCLCITTPTLHFDSTNQRHSARVRVLHLAEFQWFFFFHLYTLLDCC